MKRRLTRYNFVETFSKSRVSPYAIREADFESDDLRGRIARVTNKREVRGNVSRRKERERQCVIAATFHFVKHRREGQRGIFVRLNSAIQYRNSAPTNLGLFSCGPGIACSPVKLSIRPVPYPVITGSHRTCVRIHIADETFDISRSSHE